MRRHFRVIFFGSSQYEIASPRVLSLPAGLGQSLLPFFLPGCRSHDPLVHLAWDGIAYRTLFGVVALRLSPTFPQKPHK